MVNDERVSIMYEGDGQNKTFAYPYSFTRKEDIVGYVISNGKTKRISTNFEFNPTTKQYTYPKNGTPLARNESVLLTRETPRNNTLQLPNEPIYTALQGQLDKIVRMIQELGSHHKGIPLQVLSEQFDTVIPTQIGNAYLRINRERNAIELVENPFDGVERITSEVTSTKANIDRIKAQIDGIHTESLTMYGEIKEKLSRVDRDTETLKERAKQEIRSTQQTVLQSLEQIESDITRRLKSSDILQSVGAVETKAREIKGYVGTMENSIAELRNIQSSTIATKEEINQLKASVIEKASAAEGHAHNLEQAIEQVKGISNGIQSMQQSILDKNREAESMRDAVNQLLQEYKSYAATIVRDMQGYVSSATSEVQKAKEWANKAGAAKTGNWVTQEDLESKINYCVTKDEFQSKIGNCVTQKELQSKISNWVTKDELQTIQTNMKNDIDHELIAPLKGTIKNDIERELISPLQTSFEEEKRKVSDINNSIATKISEHNIDSTSHNLNKYMSMKPMPTSINDWNNLTDTGMYEATASMWGWRNAPSTTRVYYYGVVQVIKSDTNKITQVFYSYGANNKPCNICYRTFYNAWGGWHYYGDYDATVTDIAKHNEGLTITKGDTATLLKLFTTNKADTNTSLAPTLAVVKELLGSVNIDITEVLKSKGVRYDFSNESAWYLCLGQAFGNLIIQGGTYKSQTNTDTVTTFPIAFTKKCLTALRVGSMYKETLLEEELQIKEWCITSVSNSSFRTPRISYSQNYMYIALGV